MVQVCFSRTKSSLPLASEPIAALGLYLKAEVQSSDPGQTDVSACIAEKHNLDAIFSRCPFGSQVVLMEQLNLCCW